jgi:hypothetical protein
LSKFEEEESKDEMKSDQKKSNDWIQVTTVGTMNCRWCDERSSGREDEDNEHILMDFVSSKR